MTTSKHFKEYELKKCDPPCSLQDMDQETINKADRARDIAGIPFIPVSAYRTPEHDKSKGRSGTGAHTKGRAIDFKCDNSSNRFIMVDALLKAGFKRIGIAKTFVHADDSLGHDQEVMWLY